jgi:hypothetical protein
VRENVVLSLTVRVAVREAVLAAPYRPPPGDVQMSVKSIVPATVGATTRVPAVG